MKPRFMHVKRCLVLLLVLAPMLTVFDIDAEAVSYNGRGSKNDPYLVETAEQLQGMKDNLSAHYKLANTIDMTGIAFTPVGHQGSPFTGSFICDLDSDGTPKYAIKNLSVSIKGVPNYADYVKGKNKWQAALFGAATKATVTNIALLDVNISNTVEGKNQMNADYSLNPGMDEMATAALIGMAENVTVTGCSATGIINSLSNHTGGLVGHMEGGEITKSYTQITFQQTGRWCNGGMVGSMEEGKITESFSSSDLSNAQSSSLGWGAGTNTTAGFVGSTTGNVVIENCYATGAVCTGGASFFSTEGGAITGIRNCYATGKVAGVEQVKAGAGCTNAYILNAAGCVQEQFTAGTEADIKGAFSSNTAWDVSEKLPVLKNVKVIADASKYVPSAGSTNPGENTPSVPATNPTEGEKSTVAADYAAKVADYLEKSQNNTLTVDEAFDALELETVKAQMTTDEMIELGEINPYINDDYSTIVSKVKLFLVSTVVGEIEAMPAAEAMTAEDSEKVFEIYNLYQRLPEEFRNAINDDTAAKIDSGYKKAYQLKYITINQSQTDEGQLGTLELVLVITFGVICLAACCGVVITSAKMVKLTKKENKAC